MATENLSEFFRHLERAANYALQAESEEDAELSIELLHKAVEACREAVGAAPSSDLVALAHHRTAEYYLTMAEYYDPVVTANEELNEDERDGNMDECMQRIIDALAEERKALALAHEHGALVEIKASIASCLSRLATLTMDETYAEHSQWIE